MELASLITTTIHDIVGKKHPAKKNEAHILAGLGWLKTAQDVTTDGGVSAWYSLLYGWRPSYVETTGYIINTFFAAADLFSDPDLVKRAIAMADFLIDMQLKNGSYRSHPPTQKQKSYPIVFDTGQDLLGMVETYQRTKHLKYKRSATKAADWLIRIQEKNGSWIKHTFANQQHTYHTRVAWGLLEVFNISKNPKYKEAALKALEWAASNQLANGWFTQNELQLPTGGIPYTHTISYAVEGFLWSGLLLKKQRYLDVAERGARPLATYFLKHKWLPASFDQNWQTTDRYSCLTGNAQLALMWGELFKLTHDSLYYRAMKRMNMQLKQLQDCSNPNNGIRGALKGSQPIYGDLLRNQGYCRMAYLNWATKFFVDALLVETQIENSKK